MLFPAYQQVTYDEVLFERPRPHEIASLPVMNCRRTKRDDDRLRTPKRIYIRARQHGGSELQDHPNRAISWDGHSNILNHAYVNLQ